MMVVCLWRFSWFARCHRGQSMVHDYLCSTLRTWLIHQHDAKFHAYVDDSQLYTHCHCDDVATSAAQLSQYVVDIGHWMAANCLQMNPANTELFWAGTKQNVS